MEVLSVCGGALLHRPCMFKECVCCDCDPSVHVDAPSIDCVCILPFCILCLSAIRMMFVKKYCGGMYVGGYGSLSESRLYVVRKLCAVGFLVLSKC